MTGHHAVVVFSGEPEKYKVADTDTAEVSHTVVDTIGIDSIRTLITEAYRRPQEGFSEKTIVISATKITSEAQQSALKILEEPPSNVSIVLVLPTGTQLLDTVLSRVEVLHAPDKSSSNVFVGWLGLSYKDRLAEIETRIKAKDSLWLQSFKTDLQTYYTNHSETVGDEAKETQLVIENLLTRGASNKMLLEHLALSLPLTS